MSRRSLFSSASWRLGEPYGVKIVRSVEGRLVRSDVTICSIRTPRLTREDFERDLHDFGYASMYIAPNPHPKRSK